MTKSLALHRLCSTWEKGKETGQKINVILIVTMEKIKTEMKMWREGVGLTTFHQKVWDTSLGQTLE